MGFGHAAQQAWFVSILLDEACCAREAAVRACEMKWRLKCWQEDGALSLYLGIAVDVTYASLRTSRCCVESGSRLK